MPRYDFTCSAHGRVEDLIARWDEYEKPCPECGQPMTRLLPIPNIAPDIQPFLDENLGHEPVYVKSRRHHKQLLKDRGLVQIG
jgi:putative FmdB family regulatory protein